MADQLDPAIAGQLRSYARAGIYLRRGDTYIAMDETPYDAEDVLQQLIERHPEILAGAEARLM